MKTLLFIFVVSMLIIVGASEYELPKHPFKTTVDMYEENRHL